MGGSSSRELFRSDSKRRKNKGKAQWSKQQEVLPIEHIPHSYNYSNSKHFGSDGHDPMYMDNQANFNHQFQDNKWGVEDFPNNFDVPNFFYRGNRNNHPQLGEDFTGKFGVNSENLDGFLQRPSSANDRYEEWQFRRSIRRHYSFSENQFQFSGQDSMRDLCSSRTRCNSLNDLNVRGFLLGETIMRNRFTNSGFNPPTQNHYLDKSSRSNNPTYSAQSLVGRGGIKRYSCGSYSNDVSWGDDSNSASDDMLLFDSPVKPRVKRRQSDENQSDDYSQSNNTSENERSHSGLSFHSSSTSNSASLSLPDKDCGALNILSFPTEWSSCAVNKTGFVNIAFTSEEGKSVQKYFQRTCGPRIYISAIIRIENPFLHTLYLLKKEEMTVRNGHVDELFLYHGTKKRHMPNICEDNLDWRQYSEMHRFGKGVSFSPSVTYSSHYSDNSSSDKVLLLFKVLVSNCVLGSSKMNIPLEDEGVLCDTSIKEDTSVIVKYCDNEFYPLYKILYKIK